MLARSLYPSTGIRKVTSHIRESYALDSRSLAIFRVSVGLVILVDLIFRFRHALAFYSDAGVLPRRDAFAALNPFRWSILFANGTPEFVTFVFWVGFVAAVAMILGWKARISTVVLWVLVMSFQTRNPHLSSGADTLMRVSLFWAMFLPLGTSWSLDSYFEHPGTGASASDRKARVVSTVATFGLILQVACVYLFTAIQKDGPRWREEGTALYFALGARDVSSDVGNWIFHNAPEALLTSLTYGSLLIEFAIPIMLLLPVRNGWLRTVAVGLIVALHLGIAATMTVGLFPAISIASAVSVLPASFWEKVAVRVPFANSLRRLGQQLTGMQAPLLPRVEAASPPGIPVLMVAGNPQDEGRSEGHHLHLIHQWPKHRPSLSMLVTNIGAALAIVLMLAWNIQTVSSYETPQPLRRAAISSGLYQNWSMFAPGPQTASIWFVVEGELESGERVDLLMPVFSGDLSIRQPVVWDQSDDIVLKDKYWRKYFNAVDTRDNDMRRFAAYTCRTWNAENTGEHRLAKVTLTRGVASTGSDGMRAEPKFKQLGAWTCT